jgi:hypothetical protein
LGFSPDLGRIRTPLQYLEAGVREQRSSVERLDG